jgi:transmembrane sensor
MEINNNLIQQFFENKCTPEEFEAVLHYLDQHPEVAAKYLGIEEWNAVDPHQPVSDHSKEAVLDRLREQLTPVSQLSTPSDQPDHPAPSTIRFVRRQMSWAAAAASLLILACGGWWMASRHTNEKSVAGRSGNQREAPRHLTVSPVWVCRTNGTGKPELLALPDGSRVRLAAHSSLRYTDSFGRVRRDCWLEGVAVFTVEKDRSHPFTVYSGALATTALGTSFEVRNRITEDHLTIRLYTGKIVVRPAAPLSHWSRDVYLTAGQQVLFDSHSMLARVGRFGTPTPDGTGKATEDQNGLVFNNSSLKTVFDRLSMRFHKTISYKPSDIVGMNFTGSMATDSLPDFLRLLATMNNLEVREQPAGYNISRHND